MDTPIDIDRYPQLALLAWNRAVRTISAVEAFALYERNWRFVDVQALDPEEKDLIRILRQTVGNGVMRAQRGAYPLPRIIEAEDAPMRIIGRRKQPSITFSASAELLVEGARLNDEIHRLPTGNTTHIPKGLYRFKSLEEADKHQQDCLAAGMARIAMERIEDAMLVLDLEMTCSSDGSIPPSGMEVIEVGAVWLARGEVLETFSRFVRPIQNPVLTDFCRTLTTIAQSDIDQADSWPAVAQELAEFAGLHQAEAWGSWGVSDFRQIAQECARHSIQNPLEHLSHRNLKAEFAKTRKIKQVGLARALTIGGLVRQGEAHRALSDALAVADLCQRR